MTDNHNQRLLPLEGLYNVRDLGGYPAGDRQVRWGMLYRGGDLYGMGEQARKYLESRGLRTVVDFRDSVERSHAPDGELSTLHRNHVLSINAGNILDLRRMAGGEAGEAMMCDLYAAMVDHCRPQYRSFFSILAGEGSAPILFHCSAGKDRTGVAAALILSALGVDRELIFQDYLLSRTYIKEKYQAWLAEEPHLEPLMTVHRSYLEAALRRIEDKFGGMERFLRDEMNADLEKLRTLYLEPNNG